MELMPKLRRKEFDFGRSSIGAIAVRRSAAASVVRRAAACYVTGGVPVKDMAVGLKHSWKMLEANGSNPHQPPPNFKLRPWKFGRVSSFAQHGKP